MSSPSTPVNQPPMRPSVRHDIYIPGYATAKLGLALLGLLLILSSLNKFGPLMKMAVTGGSARGEAVRVVRTDSAGQEDIYTSDAQVLTAIKAVEDARDRESVFWVEYQFTTSDGKQVRARSPLGQHVKPLQPLRDSDGLPSTIHLWYDAANPTRIAIPLLFGTWFMPGMLVLFGSLGMFMGLLLWWNAKKPVEMPDLSRSHAEVDRK